MFLKTRYLETNSIPGDNAGESQAMVLPSTKGNQGDTGQREADPGAFVPVQLLVKPIEATKQWRHGRFS
jgi:hypothetical protein